jgi:septal ring factor EnvC (AmiA/AmiB activator)
MATHTYNYVSSSKNWTSELAVMFGVGFAAATLLWLGLWFFQTRPAQASAIQAQETELQQAQTALAQCQASVGLLTEDKAMLETEVKQLDTMLKQAWAAAARKAPKPEATGVALKADD